MWRSIARQMKAGERRSEEALLILARAYQATFMTGTASEEQREAVLADLANHCGWYKTCDKPEGLAEHNGRRKAFERLYDFLNFGEVEFAALEQAARTERGVDELEGEF